ncbi:MAG: DUF4832 domain-containing protein [Sphingobacteriales bacterium]|nr:DUF4832 domain-containing protein [Sphingobacteriales bacterium]
MKQFITGLIFCCCVYSLSAQNVTVTYKESKEDIINPERGFYIPFGTKASDFKLLDAKKLAELRAAPQQSAKTNYSVNVSLIYRAYELDIFKDKPLSESFLQNLQKDFDAVREAGLKMILRFAYVNTTHGGDCKDEYKICPPYGDAPREIVLMHVKQLKPLFRKNGDVIAVLQQGFIGIWGENYFTDYFGCGSNDGAGVIADSSWLHRNEFLKALLGALPMDRMVQVRTPQIKQRYVYGPRASLMSRSLTTNEAFSKKDIARIGFHNDCFLASEDDYGTFYDYGNSVSKRDTANKRLREYFKADSRYVAVGGETCDDAYSPQNDCAPAGFAEEEMRQMHYSYLNTYYNTDVISDWDSLGCLYTIKRQLGYRFILKKAMLPAIVKNGSLKIQLQIENAGYASMYNKRPVKLVLRNTESGKEIMLNLNINPQLLYSGLYTIQRTLKLPTHIIPGKYKLYLFLPDANVLLQKQPEYSVKLANENLWEETTGYNSLNHSLRIH